MTELTVTLVEDGERLYRAVRCGPDEYKVVDGKVRFAAAAFNDPELKPSVDRSSMRDDPRDTRFRESDGIAQVIAHEVRAIGHIPVEPGNPNSDKVYQIDAIHRPILKSETEPRDNLAHCQVECDPGIKAAHFKKRLREALAILASGHGWIVDPGAPPEASATPGRPA